jgi:hypothetical protein
VDGSWGDEKTDFGENTSAAHGLGDFFSAFALLTKKNFCVILYVGKFLEGDCPIWQRKRKRARVMGKTVYLP